MTVKTGQAWAGSFVTLDATGAVTAATGTPSGTLYVDGVANAATVTITGSNPYKWAVTLPSLTAGQRCDMYITGTIDSVSTAGFVASEQADTVRLSDGVAVVSIATDAITADSLKADAVTEIQSGLATSSALATVDGIVDDILVDTSTTLDGKLNTIDTNVDSILADTGTDGVKIADTQGAITWGQQKIIANVESEGALDIRNSNGGGVGLLNSGNVAQFNQGGDVGVLNSGADAVIGFDSAIATAAALTTVDTNVDLVVDATTATGVLLKDAAIESIFKDFFVTGTYNFSDLLKIMASALAGELSGGGSTTLTFKSVDGASDVIVATVDANKNRTNVVIKV